MTGSDLWYAFLSAGASDTNLVELGEAIGNKKSAPSPNGYLALVAISDAARANNLDVGPAALFASLKAEMPGLLTRTSLLKGLAGDYSNRAPWAATKPATQKYLEAVALRIPVSTSVPNALPGTATPIANLSQDQIKILNAIMSKISAGQTVSDPELATARNLAARGNLTSVVAYLEKAIESRRSGVPIPSDVPWGKIAIIGTGVAASYFLFFHKRKRQGIASS